MAEPGDTCTTDGAVVCAVEDDPVTIAEKGGEWSPFVGRSILKCQSGTYVDAGECFALETCVPVKSKEGVYCAKSPFDLEGGIGVAFEGGPCASGGMSSCSLSRDALLTCIAGTWTSSQSCPGATCGHVPDTAPGCQPGAPCLGCVST